MSDQPVVVPISAGNEVIEAAHPSRGKTRLVPVVRTPVGPMFCIWRSHTTIMADVNGDGKKVPACECVLLASRDPVATMRAEVDLKAWDHFELAPVEW